MALLQASGVALRAYASQNLGQRRADANSQEEVRGWSVEGIKWRGLDWIGWWWWRWSSSLPEINKPTSPSPSTVPPSFLTPHTQTNIHPPSP